MKSKFLIGISIFLSIIFIYLISYFSLRTYEINPKFMGQGKWDFVIYESKEFGRAYPYDEPAQEMLRKLNMQTKTTIEAEDPYLAEHTNFYIGPNEPYSIFIPLEWLEVRFR